jgi:hypothetical protein
MEKNKKEYLCERCNYNTVLKGSFKRHIYKKNVCEFKKRDVDIEVIRKRFMSDNKKKDKKKEEKEEEECYENIDLGDEEKKEEGDKLDIKVGGEEGDQVNIKGCKEEEGMLCELSKEDPRTMVNGMLVKSKNILKKKNYNTLTDVIKSSIYTNTRGRNVLEKMGNMPEIHDNMLGLYYFQIGRDEVPNLRVEKDNLVIIAKLREEVTADHITEEYVCWMENIPMKRSQKEYSLWIKNKPKGSMMPLSVIIETF